MASPARCDAITFGLVTVPFALLSVTGGRGHHFPPGISRHVRDRPGDERGDPGCGGSRTERHGVGLRCA